MATSRSPLAYQKRRGLEPTPGQFRSRFAPCRLLVNKYPTGNTVEKAIQADGADGSPDRAELYPWPPAPPAEE